MMASTVSSFAERIERLPPLPQIVHQLHNLTDSTGPSADAVAKILSQDAAITGRVLRVANSTFYTAKRNVTTLNRAVVVLGLVVIRNMMLGISAWNALSARGKKCPHHETLWRHSIAVAGASELVARHVKYQPVEEAFVAGLLHDIGQLCLAQFEPERFRQLIAAHDSDKPPLCREEEMLGTNHQDVGNAVLAHWQVPERLCAIAGHHHDQTIDASAPHAPLLAIVSFADALTQLMGIGIDEHTDWELQNRLAHERMGVTPADTLHLLPQLEDRVGAAIQMMSTAGEPQPIPLVAGRTAAWVSTDAGPCEELCATVVRLAGYRLSITTPGDLDALPPQEVVIFPGPPDAAPGACSRHRRIVQLADRTDDGPRRWHDSTTGVFHIPRAFTAFDLQWTESDA
jgi:putative nucleotidyltransferase with HDIG domain